MQVGKLLPNWSLKSRKFCWRRIICRIRKGSCIWRKWEKKKPKVCNLPFLSQNISCRPFKSLPLHEVPLFIADFVAFVVAHWTRFRLLFSSLPWMVYVYVIFWYGLQFVLIQFCSPPVHFHPLLGPNICAIFCPSVYPSPLFFDLLYHFFCPFLPFCYILCPSLLPCLFLFLPNPSSPIFSAVVCPALSAFLRPSPSFLDLLR